MTESDTKQKILDAARECLLTEGYAAISTRKVADGAGVPLSQIHYHLGTKEELILNVLRAENDRLLERQADMFSQDLPLADRWLIACDYLDADIESGYVRILGEMIAAGWSSNMVGDEVRQMLNGWTSVLTDVARRAEADGAHLGGLAVEEVAALVSAVFLGAESLMLSGHDGETVPIRAALRSLGRLLANVDYRASA